MSLSPLPWATRRASVPSDGATDVAIVDRTGEIIAECFGRTSASNFPDVDANANLMADAPYLRDLCAKIGAVLADPTDPPLLPSEILPALLRICAAQRDLAERRATLAEPETKGQADAKS